MPRGSVDLRGMVNTRCWSDNLATIRAGSETDRGFRRVGVSLRALPYGVLAKVGPARLQGLVSGCYSD